MTVGDISWIFFLCSPKQKWEIFDGTSDQLYVGFKNLASWSSFVPLGLVIRRYLCLDSLYDLLLYTQWYLYLRSEKHYLSYEDDVNGR